jgi:hypothetical protein
MSTTEFDDLLDIYIEKTYNTSYSTIRYGSEDKSLSGNESLLGNNPLSGNLSSILLEDFRWIRPLSIKKKGVEKINVEQIVKQHLIAPDRSVEENKENPSTILRQIIVTKNGLIKCFNDMTMDDKTGCLYGTLCDTKNIIMEYLDLPLDYAK